MGLKLLAVKGGPGCDGEIEFLERLMDQLGFRETHPPETHADGLRNWDWSIDRQTHNGGFTNYVVSLTQYPDLSRAFALPQTFAVRKTEAHCPNLRKCAVISCPVFDKD